MDAVGASYDVALLKTPRLFWAELDEVLSAGSPTLVANTSTTTGGGGGAGHASRISRSKVPKIVSGFLKLTDACYGQYLEQAYNLDHAITRLFDSAAFSEHHEYAAEVVVNLVRNARTIPSLLVGYEVILRYGQHESRIFKYLQGSARDLLPRLKHQIWAGHYAAQADQRLASGSSSGASSGMIQSDGAGWDGASWGRPTRDTQIDDASAPRPDVDAGNDASSWRRWQMELRKKAVRLLYEVCRVQKLDQRDMRAIDAKLVHHLFDLVEDTRLHADEDFNYLLIKVIVALNEQFMVSALASVPNVDAQKDTAGSTKRSSNLIMSTLKERFNDSKTFGENLIFMLNRASSSDAEDLCMQLLVLKLLYLLFTTQETAHYFYTNDLKVLVDIFVRELSDLPDESESLRHTYLRVFHPLLTCTQLLSHPYKRPEIRRLLLGLVSHGHLRDITPTTNRLVARCLQAEWCVELDALDPSNAATIKQLVGRQDSSTSLTEETADVGVAIASVQSIAGGPASQVLVETTLEEGKTVIAPDSGRTLHDDEAAAVAAAIETEGADSSSLASRSPHHVLGARTVELGGRPRGERAMSVSQQGDQASRHSAANSTSMPSTPPRALTPDFGRKSKNDLGDTTEAMSSSWHAEGLQFEGGKAIQSQTSGSTTTSRGPGPPRPPKSRGVSAQAATVARSASSTGLPAPSPDRSERQAEGENGNDVEPERRVVNVGMVEGLPDHTHGLLYNFHSGDPPSKTHSTSNGQTQSEQLPLRPPSLHIQQASADDELDGAGPTPTASTTHSGERLLSSSNATSGSSTPQRRKPPAPPKSTGGGEYLGVGLGRPRRGSMPNSPVQSRAALAPDDAHDPERASGTFVPRRSDVPEGSQPDSAPATSLPRSFLRERDQIPRATSFVDLSSKAREPAPVTDNVDAADGIRSASSNDQASSSYKIRRRPPPPPSSVGSSNASSLTAASGSYPLAGCVEPSDTYLKPRPPPVNRATKGSASPRPATPSMDEKVGDETMTTRQLSGRLEQLKCAH